MKLIPTILCCGVGSRLWPGSRELHPSHSYAWLMAKGHKGYIPAGHTHRLENPSLLNLVMIIFQSGGYLGEDDIVCFEDNYGRASHKDQGNSIRQTKQSGICT